MDKIKDVEFIVSESDFKDSMFFVSNSHHHSSHIIRLTLLAGGWAIPRKDCMRKALIGKGEFKGTCVEHSVQCGIVYECIWDTIQHAELLSGLTS